MSSNEITIPKSGTEVAFQFMITLMIAIFVVIAILDIILGVAFIASCIWLILIIILVCSQSQKQGNFHRFLLNCLGNIFGRQFAEISSQNSPQNEINFGYVLLGRRFVNQSIRIDRIESVEWSTGQATDLAGRDMNDWQVLLWYDHFDTAKSEKQRKWHRKPNQDIYAVGPSTHKDKIEAFGMEFVTFLQDAGAHLVQTERSNCFIRNKTNHYKEFP